MLKKTKPSIDIDFIVEVQILLGEVKKLLATNVENTSANQKDRYIDVKEFTKKYRYSAQWQKEKRGLVKNKLPYYQNIRGGKIRYKISEVDEWMANEWMPKKKKGQVT